MAIVTEKPPHIVSCQNLTLRARVLQAIRHFFSRCDFLEVETPCRIPAPAPEAYISAPPAGDWFLHTSPELCMKRLLAGGIPRLFQICRCFRQGERGDRHLPEFTLLEWYAAHMDYHGMMKQTEDLIREITDRIGLGERIAYQGSDIDLSPPWPRMTVAEAFRQFTDFSPEQAVAEGCFDELIGCRIEPHLGLEKPVFLHDYPVSQAALARISPGNQAVAERFELYIGGLELCNAFTELTDPMEQRRRFEMQRRQMAADGQNVYPMPERFLADLFRMPPAAGNALGIDRLVMLLVDSARIDEVVTFTPETL